jgi:hypothetical protein
MCKGPLVRSDKGGNSGGWQRVLTLVAEATSVIGFGYLVIQIAGYPVGVFVVLGVAIHIEWRGTRSELERDRTLIEKLTTMVAREDIVWLKQHDFGGPWDDDRMQLLFRLVFNSNEVEHQFCDSRLEERRGKLFEAILVLHNESSMRAGVDQHGRMSISAWDDSPSRLDPEEREARKHASRKAINSAAHDVVSAYDALLSRARDSGRLGS